MNERLLGMLSELEGSVFQFGFSFGEATRLAYVLQSLE